MTDYEYNMFKTKFMVQANKYKCNERTIEKKQEVAKKCIMIVEDIYNSRWNRKEQNIIQHYQYNDLQSELSRLLYCLRKCGCSWRLESVVLSCKSFVHSFVEVEYGTLD